MNEMGFDNLEQYENIIREAESNNVENAFKIGQALSEVKSDGFFTKKKAFYDWAQKRFDYAKSYVNYHIQIFERFGDFDHTCGQNISISKLKELVAFPEDMSPEELLNLAQDKTVKQLKEEKKKLKEQDESEEPKEHAEAKKESRKKNKTLAKEILRDFSKDERKQILEELESEEQSAEERVDEILEKKSGSETDYKKAFSECQTESEVKVLYRKLVKMAHPDQGGSDEEFIKLKESMDKALKRVNGGNVPDWLRRMANGEDVSFEEKYRETYGQEFKGDF